jgi:hypothetical protein
VTAAKLSKAYAGSRHACASVNPAAPTLFSPRGCDEVWQRLSVKAGQSVSTAYGTQMRRYRGATVDLTQRALRIWLITAEACQTGSRAAAAQTMCLTRVEMQTRSGGMHCRAGHLTGPGDCSRRTASMLHLPIRWPSTNCLTRIQLHSPTHQSDLCLHHAKYPTSFPLAALPLKLSKGQVPD